MTDFYVTLFSNTSQNTYPENSTSKFTVTLPKPLKLTDAEYRVGITQCHHPAILGIVNSAAGEEQDSIVFPRVFSEESFVYDLNTLASFILSHCKRPSLYTKRYFYEFLSIDNLREFNVNETLQKYKTTIADNTHKFKITPYVISSQYRISLEDRDYIEFQSNKKYT